VLRTATLLLSRNQEEESRTSPVAEGCGSGHADYVNGSRAGAGLVFGHDPPQVPRVRIDILRTVDLDILTTGDDVLWGLVIAFMMKRKEDDGRIQKPYFAT